MQRKTKILGYRTTIWHVSLSALILLVVVIVAGVAYVYFSDSGLLEKSSQPKTTMTHKPITPKLPSPTAPESAAVTFLTDKVEPGNEASLIVQTLPGSKCEVSVSFASKNLVASGLEPKISDDFGSVSWNWMVAKSAPVGRRSLSVTCRLDKRSAVVDSSYLVSRG